MNAYQMCIANIARKLRAIPESKRDSELNAFDYSLGIAVGFCKDPNEVVLDIVNFKEDTNVVG